MNKRYGAKEAQDCLQKCGRHLWELWYGYGEDDEQGYNYHASFDHKPSIDEVKTTIVAQINANTDEKILSGFEWRGMAVWLSNENQFNYKAAYDLAVQTGGSILPVTFKFGTDEEPTYYTFTDLEELGEFVQLLFKHINDALSAGWREKDGVDWEKFQ
jgi:hypothetical protein